MDVDFTSCLTRQMCVAAYHQEVAEQQDRHQDGDHQVVQQRERPPGHIVETSPLLLKHTVTLVTSTHTSNMTSAANSTLLVTWTSALLSSRYCTTCRFPWRQAAMRGVSPLSSSLTFRWVGSFFRRWYSWLTSPSYAIWHAGWRGGGGRHKIYIWKHNL